MDILFKRTWRSYLISIASKSWSRSGWMVWYGDASHRWKIYHGIYRKLSWMSSVLSPTLKNDAIQLLNKLLLLWFLEVWQAWIKNQQAAVWPRHCALLPTCPAWCWVGLWRWPGPPQIWCCPRWAWLSRPASGRCGGPLCRWGRTRRSCRIDLRRQPWRGGPLPGEAATGACSRSSEPLPSASMAGTPVGEGWMIAMTSLRRRAPDLFVEGEDGICDYWDLKYGMLVETCVPFVCILKVWIKIFEEASPCLLGGWTALIMEIIIKLNAKTKGLIPFLLCMLLCLQWYIHRYQYTYVHIFFSIVQNFCKDLN